jgi:hypothetical protein
MTSKTTRAPAGALALPVEPLRRRKPKRNYAAKAKIAADLAAQRFEAIKLEFHWSNDQWAAMWLPWVRVAACQVANNDADLTEAMKAVANGGGAPDLLEGFERTKRQFSSLVELMNAAQMRTFVALDRLGYSPDNLPPVAPKVVKLDTARRAVQS